MPTVRRLAIADLDALLCVRRDALLSSPRAFSSSPDDDRGSDRSLVAKKLSTGSDDDIVFGVGTSSRLLGMVGFCRQSSGKLRHRAVLWGMFVREDARGQGVGGALVSSVVRHARSLEGLLDLHLGVAVDNAPAQALYARSGFEAWATERRAVVVHGEAIDEIHMRLLLQELDS